MNTNTNPSTNPNANPNTNPNTNPNSNPNTNPNTNPNAGTHASGGRISSFKTAIRGVHGASEVLRGSLNQAVDSAFGNHEAAAHHKAVTEKGLSRMGYSGVSSGPTPVGSAAVQQQPHGQPAGHVGVEPATVTENNAATNNGPHVATASNRLDPRVRDGEPAIAGDTTMPAAVDPQVRRPDDATIEQGATTETGHHKHVLNPSAINFKFWKKGEGDTGKVDNTLVGVNKNTNHQDNLASTNYDGRTTAPGVAGGKTVNEHPIPHDAHGTNPNNEPDHSNATAAAPHTEHTQTQHQYQQPALPPHTAQNGTAEYPSGSTTTTKPGTSKFAENLGAGTSTGTRMEGPPVANMD